MAEALALASGVASLLTLVVGVTNTSHTFFQNVRHASEEIQSYFLEMTNLEKVLRELDNLVNNPKYKVLWAQHGYFLFTENGVNECRQILEALQEKLRKATPGKSKAHRILNHLRWPFTANEVQKVVDRLHRIQGTFHASLSIQGFVNGLETLEGVQGLERSNKELQRSEILKWLCCVDPSTNHNNACAMHEPSTGQWFIRSRDFARWNAGSNRLLILAGIPGSGKTILCSTIIEHVKHLNECNTDVGFAYYYFDFNDMQKQTVEGFLSSVLKQLSCQKDILPKEVRHLHEQNSSNSSSRLQRAILVEVLFAVASSFREVVLIIDALDECHDRKGLASLIVQFVEFTKLRKFRVLGTSRREQDLELAFHDIHSEVVALENPLVDEDIALHIRSRLKRDLRLQAWSISTKHEIEMTLTHGAHGMFRWVDCQLDVLCKCLTLSSLRHALSSLPKTLDETYRRVLLQIDEDYRREAYVALQWLAFSLRPLTLAEVAEAIVVRPDSGSVSAEERLRDPHDILLICSSLVILSERGELRLAHYSVKEFLISERIRTGPASTFAMAENSANRIMSETCLAHLFYSNQLNNTANDPFGDLPLLRYSAQFWYSHARKVPLKSDRVKIDSLALELLDPGNRVAMMNWLSIAAPDQVQLGPFFCKNIDWIGSSLYYASYCGLVDVAHKLLAIGEDVNAMSGKYGSCLSAAACTGNVAMVRLLVESGAKLEGSSIHLQDSLDDRLLDIRQRNKTRQIIPNKASREVGQIAQAFNITKPPSHESADIRRHEDDDATALKQECWLTLRLAAATGETAEVKRLLDCTEATGDDLAVIQDALQEAAFFGHQDIVELLLRKGANVNARGGPFGTAMQAAARKKQHQVVEMLIEHGYVGEESGPPLHHAAWSGHAEIVQYLVDQGADIHALDCDGATALHWAAWKGYVDVMEILLDKGVDTSIQDGAGGSALHFAACFGNDVAAKLLLDRGADVNAKAVFRYTRSKHQGLRLRCTTGRTPLHEAAWKGRNSTIRLLVERGANLSAEDENGWTALQRAAIRGLPDTVRLLMYLGTSSASVKLSLSEPLPRDRVYEHLSSFLTQPRSPLLNPELSTQQSSTEPPDAPLVA